MSHKIVKTQTQLYAQRVATDLPIVGGRLYLNFAQHGLWGKAGFHLQKQYIPHPPPKLIRHRDSHPIVFSSSLHNCLAERSQENSAACPSNPPTPSTAGTPCSPSCSAPVATVALDGAKNAGILAAQIIGGLDAAVRERILAYKKQLEEEVLEKVRRMGG
jgi:hypothetical protein